MSNAHNKVQLRRLRSVYLTWRDTRFSSEPEVLRFVRKGIADVLIGRAPSSERAPKGLMPVKNRGRTAHMRAVGAIMSDSLDVKCMDYVTGAFGPTPVPIPAEWRVWHTPKEVKGD